MTKTALKAGDEVRHRKWNSYGVGRIVEMIPSPLPSIPPKRCRVKFGSDPHITRTCFIEDLCEPATMQFGGHQTRLVASDGDLVA